MTEPLALCVPPDLIGVTQLFVSTEVGRPYLQGICLEALAERTGVTSAATDGHRLAAVHAANGHVDNDVILTINDKNFLRLCRKNARQRHEDRHPWVCAWPGTIKPKEEQGAGGIELLLVSANGERPDHDMLKALVKHAPDPKLTTGYGIIARAFAEPIDATFPSWRRVVPHRKVLNDGSVATCDTGRFNPSYVQDFAEVARIYGSTMRMIPADDADAPHLVDAGFADFVGVIMPMRDGVAPNELYQPPAWARVPSAKDAATAAEFFPEEEKFAA